MGFSSSKVLTPKAIKIVISLIKMGNITFFEESIIWMMIVKKRFSHLPSFIIAEQQNNPLTKDLYLFELAEILIKRDIGDL